MQERSSTEQKSKEPSSLLDTDELGDVAATDDTILDATPAFLRRPESLSEIETTKLELWSLTRRARESFVDACQASEPVSAEASFAATKDAVANLWSYVALRDEAFQDLLALVDVATSRKEFVEIDQNHHDAIHLALADLVKPFIEDNDVDENRMRFAQSGIDVLAPIRELGNRRFQVTIEELDD